MPSSDPLDVGLLSPVTSGHDELVADAAIAAALVEVEIALARASAEVGIAPAEAAQSIAGALTGYRPDAAGLARQAVDGGNPVIPLVADLRSRVGAVDPDAAIWVHRGATSQDVIDSALMLVATRALAAIDASLAVSVLALIDLADRHRGTLMAARTLTRQSTPTTFGLVASGWLLGVDTARRGLPSALPAQLGGASGTLASFVELGGAEAALALPGRFADELGLARPVTPWHTRRAPITGLGDSLATVLDALGVIAADVATLGRDEIGELAEAGGTGRGGSSTMPQKQNPVLSILIRSAAQRAPGLGAELHRSAALAVDQRPDGAWHAEWPTLRELLRLGLGASALAGELLGGLRVDVERMRANAEAGGPGLLAERFALTGEPQRAHIDAGLLDLRGYIGVADDLIDAAIAAARAS